MPLERLSAEVDRFIPAGIYGKELENWKNSIKSAIKEAEDERSRQVIKLLETFAFAEPQPVPAHGRTPVIICIDVDEWQELQEELK